MLWLNFNVLKQQTVGIFYANRFICVFLRQIFKNMTIRVFTVCQFDSLTRLLVPELPVVWQGHLQERL